MDGQDNGGNVVNPDQLVGRQQVNNESGQLVPQTQVDSILQLLPDDHEGVLDVVQDHLNDEQICSVLCSPDPASGNKVIVKSLIENKSSVAVICDQLEQIIPLSTDQAKLRAIIGEIRTGSGSVGVVTLQLPQKITVNEDFALIKTHYHAILRLMPPEYEMTVGKLQTCFSDEEICIILSSSDAIHANKVILDSLVDKIRNKRELYKVCDQLEMISASHDLNVLIANMRSGLQQSIPSCPVTTASSQQVSSPGGHNAAGVNSFLYQNAFYKLSLASNSKVLAILKKNYSRLCQCLPQNYMKTATKIKQMGAPDNFLYQLTTLPSVDVINEAIMSYAISSIKSDSDSLQFCDIVDTLIDSDSSRQFIATLRHDPPLSKTRLQEEMRYKQERLHTGFSYQQPPPLPANHINRPRLLEDVVHKLSQTVLEPDTCRTSLTITGAGGFGKTNTVIALCHHPSIKEKFADGFVFIELGPQAQDPSIKLKGLYNLLTDNQCDVNVAEPKIVQFTSAYCRNLLVIIDDVWHAEDAEPIVRAFRNCKIVLTTRMNDLTDYIPTQQTVSVGPMEQSEAISLLTHGVIDCSRLSQEDMSSLDELVEEVHLWPLLLSLVRGQLSHNLKLHHSSYHSAVQSVKAKLHDRGLTAFDKNNLEDVKRSRKYAVRVCIDVTLELLTKSLSDKIKSLILYTGIGTSLLKTVLDSLWNISKEEAKDAIDLLWSYGLVQFITAAIPPHHNPQHCVEVHAVISQYMIDNLDSEEVNILSPYVGLGTAKSVTVAVQILFQQLYGIENVYTLSAEEFLKYKLSELENCLLPLDLKMINMFTITDPHLAILTLRRINDALMTSPVGEALFPMLVEEIGSLISESQKVLKDAHKMSRKLNQAFLKNVYENSYDSLLKSLEEYVESYPICQVAVKAIAMVNRIIPYVSGDLLNYFTAKCEQLKIMSHVISIKIVPKIKVCMSQHERIKTSLLTGQSAIESMYRSILSGKFNEEEELAEVNSLIKLQEIAPNFAQQQVM
ncbi:uncharacterized protein [Dysidea avara]|uniref:uncharacterized protein isoform X2 n=1 Tax=Dysidea avara TaxID=196820 RepID=UPI00332D7A6E